MAVVEIVNEIKLNSSLIDYNGNPGTSGQILSSVGDGVDWINNPSAYELTVAGGSGGPFNVTNSGQLFLTGGIGIETPQTQTVSGSTTITYNLTTANPAPGTYANANITVDAYGRVTLATANSNVVEGVGTVNYLPKWSATDTLTSSVFYETSNDLYIPNYIRHIGDDSFIGFPINDRFVVYTGNSERIRVTDGSTLINNILSANDLLNVNNQLQFKTPIGTTATYNGEIVDFGAINGLVAAGDLVVLRHSLGLPQWYRADYNAAINATGMLGVFDGTNVLVRGFVQDSTLSFTTSGQPLYLGLTGDYSTSAPTATGDYVRIIGYVADAANDRIYFCPDNTWVLI
jgi:hypothetical protein